MGGTIEKFIGDAIMAVFGLPVLHDDDALRAVRASLEMRDALAWLNAESTGARGVTLAARIGINTGEVMAGDASTRQTLVTGDAVNTAARLEQAASAGEILLGPDTWRLVRDVVTVERIEPIGAKGKAEPIPAVRLVSVDRAPGGLSLRFDAPLLGRGSELDRLHSAFEQTVADRRTALVAILGPAGVGKSRLLAEFVSTLAGRARILRGRCLAYGDGITYWPLRELLLAVAGIRDSDSPAAGSEKLREMLDGAPNGALVVDRLATAIGLSTERASSDEIFWAVRRMLEHLARSGPLVVVIEDIHWAEPTLLELIDQVVRSTRGVALLVVCLARPELLDRVPDFAVGGRTSMTISVDALAPEVATHLIQVLPGGVRLPADLRDRILATAEGNPLFIEEMLRMLLEDGLLGASVDSAAVRGPLGGVVVPPTIQALMAARLDRLPAHERSAAQRASVVGRVFEKPAVVALTPRDSRPTVPETLMALVRKQLVTPEQVALSAEEAFKFRHVLVRDAAYAALAKSERAELHERFADWLEDVVGDRAVEYEELLGYHLRQAHGYRVELREPVAHTEAIGERAAVHLTNAGRRARARGDSTAAVQLYRQAEALPLFDAVIRGELLLDLGLALSDVGLAADAQGPAEAVLALATETGNRGLAARARLLTIDHEGQFGAAAPALETEIRLALTDAEASRDDRALAEAWQAKSMNSWNQGQIERSDDEGRRSLIHARAAGDPRYELEVELNLLVEMFAGPLPAEEFLSASAAFLKRAASYPTVRAEGLGLVAVTEAMLGRFKAARDHAWQSIETLLDLAQFYPTVNARTFLAWTERLAGDLSVAESVLR